MEALSCRVTTTSFLGGQIKNRNMATEGHACDGKKNHPAEEQ
jgi:hypothetical protein